MDIILTAEPFIIKFNLDEKVWYSNDLEIYKFSLSFSHYRNVDIKFILPESYQAYLYGSDIKRLIKGLTEKVEQLTKPTNKEEVDINFSRNCYVSYEHDIEIIVDTGEYYPLDNEGGLELLILFNINVAYKESWTSMVGLRENVDLKHLEVFIKGLRKLVEFSYT